MSAGRTFRVRFQVHGPAQARQPWETFTEPCALFTHPCPYQIKNSPFGDKVTPGQDVDLHGVAEVGDQELIWEKETGP